MSLKARLKLALSHDGKKRTQAELARACGIKPPSVSSWFSGETLSLEGENLVRAAGYLGVNPHWLAIGEGQMVGESKSPANDQFSGMPDRLKAVTLTIAGMFRVVPEDQWAGALLKIAELMQKDRRFP
jgi:transcriptional regulator with XRE-family HTH domain